MAGGMGKTCVAPLERVKILFQVRIAIRVSVSRGGATAFLHALPSAAPLAAASMRHHMATLISSMKWHHMKH